MAWIGSFSISMTQALRGVDGYFREEDFGLGVPDGFLTVTQATANRVTFRSFEFLGEISFIGTGLQLAPQSINGSSTTFPKLTGGTISRIEMRFNQELDGLITALAFAETAQQRAAIQEQINNVTNINFLRDAGEYQTDLFSAAALGNAVQASYEARSDAPMTAFLSQFNFINVMQGEGDLVGFNRADRLVSGTGNSLMSGQAGNDTLDAGGGGLNQMFGGEGSDIYIMGPGTEIITDNGTGANDVDLISFERSTTGMTIDLEFIDGANTTGIGQGDQWGGIEGAIGSNFSDVMLGRSFVQGNLSSDLMFGGDGDDSIQGGEGSDTLSGGRGFDVLLGGPNFDLAGLPGPGDVGLWAANFAQADFFSDPNGVLVVTPNEGVDLVNGIELFRFADQTRSISELTASSAQLGLGDATANTLGGGGGRDLMFGRGGDDALSGQGGNDRIDAGDGADTASGGAGSDTIAGGNGADVLFGNQGADWVQGGSGLDRLDGGLDNDSLEGGNGDDTVIGGGGFDTLRGGNGNDRMIGGDGRDEIHMGAGNDLFIDNTQAGVNGQDTVFANAGDDTLGGGAGNDVFNGQDGRDVLFGRLGDDRLFGGNQNDTLEGGDGADTVAGGNGQDRAFLGNGNDSWFDNDQVQFGDDLVVGGNGNDTIRMGGGNDTAIGGNGADVFIFADAINLDRIIDYQVGIDRLQIDSDLWDGARNQARLNALTDVVNGNLVFDFGDGDTLMLQAISSTNGLLADIMLV